MFRYRVVVGLAVLIGLSGCGGSSSPDAGQDADAGAAEVEGFAALPVAEQEARVKALSAQVERELFAASGLEEALGGPAAADAAFEALTTAMNGHFAELRESPPKLKLIAYNLAQGADGPSAGGLMFGGYLAATMGADAAIGFTADGQSGTGSQESRSGDMSRTFEVNGSREQISVRIAGEFSEGGISGKLKSDVDMTVCPDANGEVRGKVVIDVSASKTGTNTGQNARIEVDFAGQVNANADLGATDVSSRMQMAEFSGGKGAFVDVTTTMGIGASTSPAGATVNRQAGSVTQAQVTSASQFAQIYAMLVAIQVVDQAEKAWKSGRCVKIDATTEPAKRDGIEPGSTATITAAPRSLVDGSAVGGTVTATLTGGASLNPAGTPVPADARFTSTAPAEVGATATVALEARSKRGIGKADVTFSTGKPSYTADGSDTNSRGDTMQVTGTIPDLSKPFTLQGAITGGTVTLKFTPKDDRSGRFAVSGAFGLSGGGSYTITGEGSGPLTLKTNGRACVGASGVCDTSNATITLTPTS